MELRPRTRAAGLTLSPSPDTELQTHRPATIVQSGDVSEGGPRGPGAQLMVPHPVGAQGGLSAGGNNTAGNRRVSEGAGEGFQVRKRTPSGDHTCLSTWSWKRRYMRLESKAGARPGNLSEDAGHFHGSGRL